MFAMEVVEMDQEIVKEEGMSIPDIFATYGEEYFRNCETELLKKMQSRKMYSISCGGGVVLRECNVEPDEEEWKSRSSDCQSGGSL